MCGAGGPEPSESCFHLSKGHTGLDSYQVRTRISWHRCTTLVLIAFAFLAVPAATNHNHPDQDIDDGQVFIRPWPAGSADPAC